MAPPQAAHRRPPEGETETGSHSAPVESEQRTPEERGSPGDGGSAPRRNDKPGPATARTSEWFDEVQNLRRVGSLARDQPGSRFGDTLGSSRSSVSHGGRGSSRGEDPGSRVHGREREDPEEGEPQEGIGPSVGVTPGGCATDSQGEQGPGGGPRAIRRLRSEEDPGETSGGHRPSRGGTAPWEGKALKGEACTCQRGETNPQGVPGRKPPRG